jgi:hypothetical protein
MASIVLNGDTSGSVTLSPPAVAGTQTVTLPAATGTVMVSGNMPAFSAYQNGNVSISSATATKFTFNVEVFDTASCYDPSTSRFTPNVAGYYQVNANAGMDVTNGTIALCWVYKNGTSYKRGVEIAGTISLATFEPTVSCLVYMNGTTDYIEIYGYMTGTAPSMNGDRWFDACLIRSA